MILYREPNCAVSKDGASFFDIIEVDAPIYDPVAIDLSTSNDIPVGTEYLVPAGWTI